jgi:hypothetical protein
MALTEEYRHDGEHSLRIRSTFNIARVAKADTPWVAVVIPDNATMQCASDRK